MKRTVDIIKELGIDSEYEVWYKNRRKNILRLVEGEGTFKSKKIKMMSLDTDDELYKKSVVDNRTVYIFNYREGISIVLIFDSDKVEIGEGNLAALHDALGAISLEISIEILEEEKRVLLETITSISKPLELEQVLAEILEGALKLLPKTSVGYIQLYDEGTKTLTLKSQIGFNSSIFGFRPEVGESITGKVYLDGKPRLYNSRSELVEAAKEKEVSERNITYLENSMNDNVVNGLICVPIKHKDNKIGVMTMHKTNSDVTLTPTDLELLTSFASQAAVVIDNTILFSNLKKNIIKMEEMNKEISLKNKMYKDLTRLSLMNKGVSEMASSLSKITDIPIILYNKIKSEIQFNNLNLDYTDDELINIIDDYEEKDIGLSSGQYEDLHLYPIKNGNVFLGYLITDSENIGNEKGINLLKDGVLSLTLELMRGYILEDVIYKRTHEYFTKILNSSDKKEIDDYRQRLGLPGDRYYTSIIASISNYKDLQILEMDMHNIISSLKREFEDVDYLIYGFHNKINLTLYTTTEPDLNKIKEKLEKIVEQERKSKVVDLSIGIGSSYRGINGIPKSYKEADMALSYIVSSRVDHIIEYDEIGINRLFVNHMPDEMNHFIEDVLGNLETEEAIKSNLEETLLTYVATNKSAVETAEKLHIHINTFYNRLKRIEKILDVDFDNPEDNLKVQLACHLKKNKENIVI